MRFYDLQIFTDKGAPFSFAGSAASPKVLAHWSSLFPTGAPDPGALNIDFDIAIFGQHEGVPIGTITIWGVGLTAILQSGNLTFVPENGNQKKIKFSYGMSKGLPLANPNEIGTPVYGAINQNSFANWQGINQSLTLVIVADGKPVELQAETPQQTTPTNPAAQASITQATAAPSFVIPYGSSMPLNILINWKKGQWLGDVLRETISSGLPALASAITISPLIVAPQDTQHFVVNLQQLAQFARSASIGAVDPKGTKGYPGVYIYIYNNVVVVSDAVTSKDSTTATGGGVVSQSTALTTSKGSTADNPKNIDFTDIVGQPIWTGPQQLQVQLVARSDIYPSSFIRVPVIVAQSTQASYSGAAPAPLSISGTFYVTRVRTVGSFRNPSVESWMTIIDATTLGYKP